MPITQDEVLGGLEMLNDADEFDVNSPENRDDKTLPVKAWKFKKSDYREVDFEKGVVSYHHWVVKDGKFIFEPAEIKLEHVNLVNIPSSSVVESKGVYPIPQRRLKDTEEFGFWLGSPAVVKFGADSDLTDSQKLDEILKLCKLMAR